jgi:hypothetical protein
MTCTVSVWPSKTWRSIGAPRLAAAAAVAVRVQVGHVQEGGALQPDVDEGALHARQHAHHLAQVDVADQAALERALDVQLLHRAVLDDGDARLLRGPVDEDVLAGHGGESSGAVGYRVQPHAARSSVPSRAAAGP